MPYDPEQHHRRSIRLAGFDYSRVGGYFITICVNDRQCLLGDVLNDEVVLSDAGRIVQACWAGLPQHYPNVQLDAFVIMPNHIHGIVMLVDPEGDSRSVGAGFQPALSGGFKQHPLSEIIRGFKTFSARQINEIRGQKGVSFWQRDYFEHVIRSDHSCNAIREYIQTNPQRWVADNENPRGSGLDDVEVWVMELQKKVGSKSPSTKTERAGLKPAPTERCTNRIGHGYDLHRLKAGGSLVLGGVTVANDLSPVAHSDGDVVIHAIVDAILGALALGDIGEHFPNSDPRWKGAASKVFLETAMAHMQGKGYRIANLDITILAERPRLLPYKQAMRQSLCEMMHVPETCVNLKAGTNEGCDAIGRGEAIAAHAVVLLAAI